MPCACQELLYFFHDRVAVADPRRVIDPFELDELRPGDPFGHVTASLDRDLSLIGPVKNQCWYPDRRQELPDV
jgi:hypothetical protein